MGDLAILFIELGDCGVVESLLYEGFFVMLRCGYMSTVAGTVPLVAALPPPVPLKQLEDSLGGPISLVGIP